VSASSEASPAQGGIQPSGEAESHPRGRPALEGGRVSPEGCPALERGRVSPEGASSP
jgi:hypothetical protein